MKAGVDPEQTEKVNTSEFYRLTLNVEYFELIHYWMVVTSIGFV